MAKFRKKVEEFIAHQWLGEGHSVPGIEAVYDKATDKNTYFVESDHGREVLNPTDWVGKDEYGYFALTDKEMKSGYEEVQ